jgi:hypothetical protein
MLRESNADSANGFHRDNCDAKIKGRGIQEVLERGERFQESESLAKRFGPLLAKIANGCEFQLIRMLRLVSRKRYCVAELGVFATSY